MANEGSEKSWLSYQRMSLGEWGRRLGAKEFPGMESMQLGAILRAAKALEAIADSLPAVVIALARLANAVERAADSSEAPGAKAKREKAEREKASRERAWAAYVKASKGAGAEVIDGDPERVMDGLSRRARNAMRRLGCETLNALAELTADDVSVQRNCGPTTLGELRRALASVGLAFAGEQ